MNPMILVVVGVLGLAAAAVVIAGQVLGGIQPWGPTLTDNMVFARVIPFTLALGLAVGALAAWRTPPIVERRADGALRRFAPATMLMHWVFGLGFLMALISGSWQYLKGILDVSSFIFMPLVYRLHYIGATLMLFGAGYFMSYWFMRTDRSLLVQKGHWIRTFRGLAHELPRPFGGILAALLGLDMRRAAPPGDQFTPYEKVISFPFWVLLLGLVLITGLLKAMRYAYPIPGEVLWWASTLHVAAMVMLAVKLLDHMRYVLAPSRWPLLVSSFTTWVSERYARMRHAGWVAQAESQAGAGAGGAAAVSSATPPPPPALETAAGRRS